jgi:hypothetical protein
VRAANVTAKQLQYTQEFQAIKAEKELEEVSSSSNRSSSKAANSKVISSNKEYKALDPFEHVAH